MSLPNKYELERRLRSKVHVTCMGESLGTSEIKEKNNLGRVPVSVEVKIPAEKANDLAGNLERGSIDYLADETTVRENNGQVIKRLHFEVPMSTIDCGFAYVTARDFKEYSDLKLWTPPSFSGGSSNVIAGGPMEHLMVRDCKREKGELTKDPIVLTSFKWGGNFTEAWYKSAGQNDFMYRVVESSGTRWDEREMVVNVALGWDVINQEIDGMGFNVGAVTHPLNLWSGQFTFFVDSHERGRPDTGNPIGQILFGYNTNEKRVAEGDKCSYLWHCVGNKVAADNPKMPVFKALEEKLAATLPEKLTPEQMVELADSVIRDISWGDRNMQSPFEYAQFAQKYG
jgi:hypothetical protein